MNPEITAALAQLLALLQAETKPNVDPPGTINGHSIQGDEDGFATVPAWTEIFAEETALAKCTPKEIQAVALKDPKRLVNRSIVENCTWPSWQAKLKAETNLVRRRSVPGSGSGLGGVPFTHAALLLEVVPVPQPAVRDWNISDADYNKQAYVVKDIATLVCEDGNGAWAANYDPAMDVAYFNRMYRQKVRDEIAAVRARGTSGFGVR